MKSILRALALALALAAMPAAAFADVLDMPKLKAMLENMGYSPKVISDAKDPMKVEIGMKAGDYDIPVGVELSSSTKYIWLTAFFGKSKLTPDEALKAMHRIFDIQPTQMWIDSKENLKVGIAVDNRDVTPANLKFVLDKLAADVASTSDVWDKK